MKVFRELLIFLVIFYSLIIFSWAIEELSHVSSPDSSLLFQFSLAIFLNALTFIYIYIVYISKIRLNNDTPQSKLKEETKQKVAQDRN